MHRLQFSTLTCANLDSRILHLNHVLYCGTCGLENLEMAFNIRTVSVHHEKTKPHTYQGSQPSDNNLHNIKSDAWSKV